MNGGECRLSEVYCSLNPYRVEDCSFVVHLKLTIPRKGSLVKILITNGTKYSVPMVNLSKENLLDLARIFEPATPRTGGLFYSM